MHPSARTEAEDEKTEWRQGRDAELAGAKILACPYPEGAQARRWREGWTAAVRGVDVAVAQAITEADIADPDPWALFPQREELIKAAHWRRCLRRHGVNPRSSGWAHLTAGSRLRGRMEPAFALLLCAPLALHPWWL